MTERQAWEHMARQWASADAVLGEDDPASVYEATTVWMGTTVHCDGLCEMLMCLRYNGDITNAVYRTMLRRVIQNAPAPTHGAGYRWPQDRDGAAKRARFCRTMAMSCEHARCSWDEVWV